MSMRVFAMRSRSEANHAAYSGVWRTSITRRLYHMGYFWWGAAEYVALPNVRAKLPAEAGAVSLVRDDAPCAADQAYSACRSGSA
jgi:hypothetical protein